jgi:antitoxin ParD1/3/4
MNISITPELEEFIEKKVKTGMYNSASEVVREGLRLLKEQDELKELRLKELKKELQKGYDSATNGNVAEWDLKQFKDKVRARGSNSKNGRNKSVS